MGKETVITDPARLLECVMTTKEDEVGKEVETKGIEYVICAIDIGSTNPKVEVWIYDPTKKSFVKKDIHIEWGDYKTQVEIVPPEHPKIEFPDSTPYAKHTKIKFLDDKHTEILMDLIKEDVKKALAGEEFNQNRQLVFAVTGFGHNLCITDRKSGKNAVILDDPSASPILSHKRKELLRQQLGKINKDLESFVDNPTTLVKILWLLQNPEALKRLFNTEENLDIGQLGFSVIRSLIASKILGDKRQIITANEKTDFALPVTAELQEIAIFLEKIGVRTHQLLFAHSQLMASHTEEHGDVLVYDDKDLPAELGVLSWAMKYGKINKNGTIICADSVGKIIFDNDTCPTNRSHDKASHTSYETQRMLANINRDWMGPLTLKHGETMNKDAYKNIDHIIKEMMAAKTETPYVYIPTEKGKGIVYKFEDGKYAEKRRSEIKSWPDSEKKLVMLAIAKGAFFGIRQKMEHIRNLNGADTTDPVYFYGGLLGHPQEEGGKDGWQQICIGAMPQGAAVYEIDLPSGATAVAFSALSKLLNEKDNKAWQKKFDSVAVREAGVGGTLQAEYQAWIEAQEKMIEHGLLNKKGNCKITKKV